MAVSIRAKTKTKSEVFPNGRSSDPSPEMPNCVVAQGTKIEGQFHSVESVRLDGTLIGDVKCDKKLVLGKTGRIEGKVVSTDAVIMGAIVGELLVTGSLHLNGTANIEGDITAKKMTMDEGARYNGGCKIG